MCIRDRFKDDKILLVKEKNGTWSLPGGWVDINQSIKTNTEKEVKEFLPYCPRYVHLPQ